jgi:4-amino-4-deoxy-L-arabinose transferase-like glycosyltransferase
MTEQQPAALRRTVAFSPPPVAAPGATVGRQVVVRPRGLPLHTATGRRTALGVLLAAAGLLYSLGLSGSGWANAYYSAAAQAGALSWKAFFFGSLDPAGAITVDKPPAALWLSGLSVRIFGLSTPALLLPQAVCAVAAVGLLYATVRRQTLGLVAGRVAAGACRTPAQVRDACAAATGLLAGTALALTPVVTLMARYNNPDALLLLLSVAAAYALVRSVEAPRGGGGWLVGAGALLGLAFLAKLLEAWLIVPVFGAVALLAGAGPAGRRLARTAAAGAAMIAAAGWWVLAVQLTPPADRPWIGGTRDDSVLSLALGYNGLGRLTGQEGGGGAVATSRPHTGARLFGTWAPEASWLLPAAVIGLVAGGLLTRGRDRRDPARTGLLLWGGWLLVVGVVLSSLHGISHSYYVVQLAPAVAGAVALGGVLVWQRVHENGAVRARRLLAVVVSLTAVWSTVLMLERPGWPLAVAPVALAAAGVAVHGLRAPLARPSRVGATILVSLLAGPAAWSVATAQAVHRGANVYSGPGVTAVDTPAGVSPGSTSGTRLPTALADRLRDGAAGYDWAAAVVGRRAADLQLATGAPVWELGGFSGRDPYPTPAEFRSAVATSRVHYLVLPAGGPAADRITRWAVATFPESREGDWLVVDLAPNGG